LLLLKSRLKPPSTYHKTVSTNTVAEIIGTAKYRCAEKDNKVDTPK
jgi:hypothetical protein